MSKIRAFSIVLHNLNSNSKSTIEDFVQTLNIQTSVVALEPYPEQDGFHAHIFLKFQNGRKLKSVLAIFSLFSFSILAPKPEGEERAWGRVQVDQMRGDFNQAHKYLTEPKKNKPLDPEVLLIEKPNEHEVSRMALANQHLERYYGEFFFPEFGHYLQGFQYVETLISKNEVVPPEWSTTYNFINGLEK